MSDYKESRCRSCGAPIIWADTESGRRMPVDMNPIGKSVVLIDGRACVRDTYSSHFATCPNADRHRTKR